MKRELLKILCLATAVCVMGMALMGAAGSGDEERAEELLQKRTDIMNNMLYGGISRDEGAEQLRTVEKDGLYSADLEAVDGYRDTDLTRVKSMEIVYLKEKTNVSNIMTFDGRIKWVCADSGGDEEFTKDYSVSVDTSGGEYRLIAFETVEK